MQSLLGFIKNPIALGNVLLARCCRWMPDKLYLRLKFRLNMGKSLNLKNPQTYSEKLQWLKLYNRNPEYTMMVDKIQVKEYVASKLGEEYIIPTLRVWVSPDDIEFDKLPERFVLKVNHTSTTGMYICKDKSKMDIEKVKNGLWKGLKDNYYIKNREWPYKDVPRMVFAEAYMEDQFGELRDYKFFCFDGKVKSLFIASDRSKGEHATRFDFFDENFYHLPFTNGHPNADSTPSKPDSFEEMKKLAEKLSKGIPHVRIDFYDVNGKIYFGEMTFFHWSGMKPFIPEEWDYKFGSWIMLPDKKF